MPEKHDPELIRKLSKTVLHAAERQRRSLFERLTESNQDRIEELLDEKPIFYENNDTASSEILLDDTLAKVLPESFFDNPTQWIEALPPIIRPQETQFLPKGQSIAELWQKPYDISKVREASLEHEGEDFEFVVKRIRKDQLNEISRAQKAYNAGIPTPKILGIVKDRGNVYALFEKIQGINLNALRSLYSDKRHDRKVWEKLKDLELSYSADYAKTAYDTRYSKYFESLLDEFNSLLAPIVIDKTQLTEYLHSHVELDKEFSFYQRVLHTPMDTKNVHEFFQSRNNTTQTKLLEHFKAKNVNQLSELLVNHRKELIENESYLYHDRVTEGRKKIFDKLFQQKFFLDLKQERDALLTACDQAGIEHKDFSDRNLVVSWNTETGKPILSKSRRPKLYVIDWEEETSSSKRGL